MPGQLACTKAGSSPVRARLPPARPPSPPLSPPPPWKPSYQRLNQSLGAILPPPHSTRCAARSSQPDSPSLALRSPPALSPPRQWRRCRGLRQGYTERSSASGLPWAWGSSAPQVRRARPRSQVDKAGAELKDPRGRPQCPLQAPPSTRFPRFCQHLEPGASPSPSSTPTHLALSALNPAPFSGSGVLHPTLLRRHCGSTVLSCPVVPYGSRTGIIPIRDPQRPPSPLS